MYNMCVERGSWADGGCVYYIPPIMGICAPQKLTHAHIANGSFLF